MSKQALFYSIISVLFFSTSSTGFDAYSHCISYYFYDQSINSSYLIFNEIVIPRYILLSYIYEISSRAGIPLGYVCSWLICYPIYQITIAICNDKPYHKKKEFSVLECLLFVFMFILSFFYSGLSLVLLWFIALFKTKKNIFLIGGLFHPVGVLLYIVGTARYTIKFNILLISFFVCFYVLSKYSIFTSSGSELVKYNITYSNFLDLLFLVFDKKKIEVIAGILLIFSFYIFSHIRLFVAINILDKIFFHRRYVNIGAIAMLLLFFIIMIDRPSLINAILTTNINDVIYAAWFDWGDKDLPDQFITLYLKRY